MNTLEEIQNCYHKLQIHITQKEFKQAINGIQQLLNICPDSLLQSKLETETLNYRYLIQYALEGKEDPSRSQILSHLSDNLQAIAEEAYEYCNIQYNRNYHYQQYRKYPNLVTLSLEEVLETIRNEKEAEG